MASVPCSHRQNHAARMPHRSRPLPSGPTRIKSSHSANTKSIFATQTDTAYWFFLRGLRHTHHESKRTGSRAGNRMKRNGRANKPRQLAGRSDPARSHAHPDSRAEGLRQRYGLAGPQLHLVSLGTCEANCAWRGAVSMHSSMRKVRREAGRAGALPNLATRARQKSRCADLQKGVR